VFPAPAAERGHDRVQRPAERREGIEDRVVICDPARDELVVFKFTQGGAEDLVGGVGTEGVGQVSVSAGAMMEGVHDRQGPLAVEDVEGWLGVEPVRRLRAWRGRG
jgi:hypothetical protein